MVAHDTCPICGKPVDPDYKPFCSRGCKDRDLLQWLGEGYRVPAEPIDPSDLSNATPGLDSPGTRD
ncbi:MAG TPA: DNA gyrase inhibitor YacG [Sphingomonas sp.]|nr:DNA gyrase inhibitor YacG [Sphingomonas sp.]